MNQLWTIVLRDRLASGKAILGRGQAIDAAGEMIAKGIAVRLVCPVAIFDEGDIVHERELRKAATERGLLPASIV